MGAKTPGLFSCKTQKKPASCEPISPPQPVTFRALERPPRATEVMKPTDLPHNLPQRRNSEGDCTGHGMVREATMETEALLVFLCRNVHFQSHHHSRYFYFSEHSRWMCL